MIIFYSVKNRYGQILLVLLFVLTLIACAAAVLSNDEPAELEKTPLVTKGMKNMVVDIYDREQVYDATTEGLKSMGYDIVQADYDAGHIKAESTQSMFDDEYLDTWLKVFITTTTEGNNIRINAMRANKPINDFEFYRVMFMAIMQYTLDDRTLEPNHLVIAEQ